MEDVIPDGDAAAVAWAEFVAQGVLRPGEAGWWKVWGASVRDIQVGDLVVTLDQECRKEALLIEETYLAKSHPLRWGMVSNGERFTLGALTMVVVLRRETHNILAESVR